MADISVLETLERFSHKYLSLKQKLKQKRIEVLVQQSLVLLVSHTELLKEQMSVPDDLLHLHVILQTGREMKDLKFFLFHFYFILWLFSSSNQWAQGE